MSLPPSLYVPGDSWLHTLDARVKLGFALLATLALMSLGSLPVLVFFLVVWHAILLSAGIPAARFVWAWRLMLPITVLIPVLWPFFSAGDGPSLVQLGPLSVTWLDVWQGLAAAVRVDAMAFAFFIWLFTTDQSSMILSLTGLGVPDVWGLAVAIALRYLPTMYTAFEQVMDAQRARGLVISGANPLQAARAYIPALVAMLIVALRTAENLARALEARAFGAPGRRRTMRQQLRFRPLDGLALAVVIIGLGGVIVARMVWGFGAGPLF